MHLVHTLQSDNKMTIDISIKRGAFIAKINSLLQEFQFGNSEVLTKLMNTYATSLYGSNTWDIFSKDCEKLYTSFNVAIRQILNVDRRTHRYLIEELSECHHLKTMLASRYVSFYKMLTETVKTPVRFLTRISECDQRTVLGRTLSTLLRLSALQTDDLRLLTTSDIKRSCKYWPIPSTEKWRVHMCKELFKVREGSMTLPGSEVAECEEILSYICVS